MNVDIGSILLILVIFQLLFLGLFLFTLSVGKRISNILLGSFFISIALNLLDLFLLKTGAYFSHPRVAGWGICFPLLFGPFIYLYTKSVLNKEFSLTAKSWKHFLPFIVFFFGTEYYFQIQPTNVEERILFNAVHNHFQISVSIVSILIFILFLLYVISSLKLVSSYKMKARQHFSNNTQINVSWLFSTILFFLSIIIITIVNGLLAQTAFANYSLIGFNIVILTMLVFVIKVLLKALQKANFFSFSDEGQYNNNLPSIPQVGKTDTENKADNILYNERKELAQRVVAYMQSNKPYLEPELSLEQLSSQLLVKPRVLSQAINDVLGQNFYDFINRHRIEEASRLLTHPKDEKITIGGVV
jgi:AraC-type DNA-binding domain-containing proteins